METITYDKIAISGVEFLRLLDLKIIQSINTHSSASITCEVTKEQGDAALASLKCEKEVILSSRLEGQTGVLFYGIMVDAEVNFAGEYYELKVILASTSYLLDKEKIKHSYSNSKLTIQDIMKDAVSGKAVISFHVTDRAMGGFMLQYQETVWEFVKRLASNCNASVTANITTKKPVIYIGNPQSTSEKDDTLETYIDSDKEQLLGTEFRQPYKKQAVSGLDTIFSGDWMGESTLKDGILTKTSVQADASAFTQEPMENSQIAGLIVTGIVKEVKKNRVKVFFDQIDDTYDADSDKWFEYSTAYAGSGGAYGSGVYFMPEEGDRVRVYFPTGSEGEGVAFASVNVSPLDDVTKMRWRSPGGQELLFTKEGIRICGKENAIFIDLCSDPESDYGIQIVCDKDINLVNEAGAAGGESKLLILAEDKVSMFADHQIKLETDSTVMEIDKDKICFNAEYVYLVDE